jgi:hypothetical protein
VENTWSNSTDSFNNSAWSHEALDNAERDMIGREENEVDIAAF